MKIFHFAPPRTALLFVIAALLTLNIISCDRDQTDTPQTTVPLSDVPVTSRACTGAASCELTVSSADEMTIEFCGAIDPSTSTCNFGCDPDNDVYYGVYVPLGQVANLCVNPSGSVCIRNAPTATHSINITVQFGSSSTPVNTTLAPGQVRCFHTNSTCSVTNTGCL
ncbi:MAG: hypothetical protein OHK0019_20960 [Saprospiraceae bacterium]